MSARGGGYQIADRCMQVSSPALKSRLPCGTETLAHPSWANSVGHELGMPWRVWHLAPHSLNRSATCGIFKSTLNLGQSVSQKHCQIYYAWWFLPDASGEIRQLLLQANTIKKTVQLVTHMDRVAQPRPHLVHSNTFNPKKLLHGTTICSRLTSLPPSPPNLSSLLSSSLLLSSYPRSSSSFHSPEQIPSVESTISPQALNLATVNNT